MPSFDTFNDLIAVKSSDYHLCIDILDHDFSLNDVAGNIRFHHLKNDGNGRPMVKALAEMLYSYILDYCIASRNREEPLTTQQSMRLAKDARNLFRHPEIRDGKDDKTGEAGEALLFFLMEAVLRAPQMVAKMELKTNHRDEVKGSDGIHARWNSEENLVDFYFGESKLYKSVNSAIKDALQSISNFHDNGMYKHEFSIVTKHFKFANTEMKRELSALITGGEIGSGVRINHACLIGYDWEKYQKISPLEMRAGLKSKLMEDGEAIVKKLNDAFSGFDKKYLCFEVFFLPFPSVSDFRNEFNAALD